MDDSISSGDLRLSAHFALPPTPGRSPGLVLCHGLPDDPRGATAVGTTYPELADHIARETGFVVLTFNFRGTGTSEGDFSAAGWLEDLRSAVTAPKCPQVYKRHTRWLTVREWRALGVVPYSSGISDNEMATLFEPEGPSGSGYLLTNNYRAILDYNCSNFYAISVGVLADAIARR